MTGPEHYREAELLVAQAEAELLVAQAKDRELPTEIVRAYSAVAQVHATLALAEAYVAGAAVMRPEDRDEWDRVTARLGAS